MRTETKGIQIKGSMNKQFEEILTEDALVFIEHLHTKFESKRKKLLTRRLEIQQQLNEGQKLDFKEDTKGIREGDWRVASIPEDLKDRRVEITGPVDRKMVINGLNSGAKVFMADFEDANSPSWENNMNGQVNLRDAVDRKIDFKNPDGKLYQLNDNPAVLKVRPRGWHLVEKYLTVNGEPISASIVDFGLYFFHNAKTLMKNGSGPYFYLPKLEHHEEAKLWNEIFIEAQNYLKIPQGTIKATVLLETLPAAFEMDEILYELKEHSAGLNCGRWDYIFSYLKMFRQDPNMILPDRSQVTMEVPFMRAYSQLVIKTCHKRGIHAMGGMAAQIPVKNDPEKNESAFEKVMADKHREVRDGHDGTWVAHPGMVGTAMEVFNTGMPEANQISKKRNDVHVTAEQLVEVPEGEITEHGLRTNINVGILYIASWLGGKGAAPIHNLMEDAATAEISRAQVWHWIRHPQGKIEGEDITLELVQDILEEEMAKIKQVVGEQQYNNGHYHQASQIFKELIEEDEFAEFLTLKAYKYL
ncbi:malate synthase A [Halobacillus sp. A1]|uniref:malate synthase A n=1 Tax=Halobacillus sp. A1 TaxID=2880262 RepID=UPI0020A669FB|nr:malate synthase A [Halobacillus sp. A1]MCP3031335.1 malate synthase A [Halobacillus sp. A1]